MSAANFDAIVIGAGHNGLVCAAYLAKAGLKPLVLEASDRIGGAAVTREFAPGYRSSAVAHLLQGLHPRVMRDLAIDRRGFGAPIATAALAPGALALEIGPDVAATAASIARHSTSDAAAYAPTLARLTKLASALGDLMLRTPPSLSPAQNDFQTKLSLGLFALKLRMLGKKDMLELTRILTINVADLANDYFESDALKALIGFDATLGVYLGPRSPNSVFNLLYRLAGNGRNGLGASYLPMGGMGAVSAALAAAAEKAGAIIRKSAPVARILVEGERAVGVLLASGEEIRAPIVAASTDPQRTLLKLVPTGQLDADFLKRIRHLRMNGCVAKLNIALDGLPEGLKGRDGRVVIAPTLDYIEHAFDCAKYGRVADRPALELTLPSLRDPSLAPAGHHVASVLYQYAPYRLRETAPDQAREQVKTRALDLLEETFPGFKARVRAVETLTPQDLESQYGLSGGQWHHGEVTLDQVFFLRPAPSFQRYAMPLPGLWLCGAGAHPGGNVTGAPGANAAREIVKQAKMARAAA